MYVKTLGSVSPYPKNYRNGVSTLIVDDGYKVLLDCGSGSSSLLDMETDLENLIIVISHLHKDHYVDLLAIGYASYVHKKLGNIKNKIKVYVPRNMSVENNKNLIDSDYEYLMNFGEENFFDFITYDDKYKIKHGNFTISFSSNPHQITTYSIKISNKASKVVYSSDTGYVGNSLESFAKRADLLICEATYVRGQPKNGNNHLYAYEAALIVKAAHVNKLLLTHFYPEIDSQIYVSEARGIFSNTKAAVEDEVIKIGGK